jgi:hypothetical protein
VIGPDDARFEGQRQSLLLDATPWRDRGYSWVGWGPLHHTNVLVPEKVPPTNVPLIVSVLLMLHVVMTSLHVILNDSDWPGVRFFIGAFH